MGMRNVSLLSAVVLLSAMVVSAAGQVERTPTPSQPPQESEPLAVPQGPAQGWALRLAGETVGLPALDWNLERIGTVEDLAVDLSSGLVEYVVFRFDRLTGADPRALYPVPLRYLQFDPQRSAFLTDIDQAGVLADAPTLDQVRSRVLGRYLWDNSYPTYWYGATGPMTTQAQIATVGNRPFYWGSGTRVFPGSVGLFSDLRGQEVTGSRELPLGRIDDLEFSMEDGTIPFVLVQPSASIGGPPVPAPLSLFTLDALQGAIAADAGPAEVRAAPTAGSGSGSAEGSLSRRLAAESFRQRVITYWEESAPGTALRPGMRVLPGVTASASLLLGLKLTNLNGDALGTVADLVVEASTRIPYAVVEFGDVLGLGGSWYFIPMEALSIDWANRLAILALDPESLRKMKGHPRGALPDTSSPDWDRDIRSFWDRYAGIPSGDAAQRLAVRQEEAFHLERRKAPGAILATGLLNYQVVNPEGDDLGDVTELIIDLEADRLAYPVISFGGFLGLGAKRFPVPPDRLTVDASRGALVLNVEPELFRKAPGYSAEQWPDTADRFWRTTIERYWTAGN